MPLYKLSDDKVIEWARAIVATIDKQAIAENYQSKKPKHLSAGLMNAYEDQDHSIWVRVPEDESYSFMNKWKDHNYSEEYLKEIFRSKL